MNHTPSTFFLSSSKSQPVSLLAGKPCYVSEKFPRIFDPGKMAAPFKYDERRVLNCRMNPLRNRRRTDKIVPANQNERRGFHGVHGAIFLEGGLRICRRIRPIHPRGWETWRHL